MLWCQTGVPAVLKSMGDAWRNTLKTNVQTLYDFWWRNASRSWKNTLQRVNFNKWFSLDMLFVPWFDLGKVPILSVSSWYYKPCQSFEGSTSVVNLFSDVCSFSFWRCFFIRSHTTYYRCVEFWFWVPWKLLSFQCKEDQYQVLVSYMHSSSQISQVWN